MGPAKAGRYYQCHHIQMTHSTFRSGYRHTCLSRSRMAPSVQAARRQLPSWLTATQVTGAPRLSLSSRPMRTSNCRTVPSTLPAMICALHKPCQQRHSAALTPLWILGLSLTPLKP